MQRKNVIIVLLVLIGTATLYIVQVNKYSTCNIPTMDVRMLQNTDTTVKGTPFLGEKRFPVVKKPPQPQPGFSTDIYLKYDTAKYTDMDGRIFIPSDTVLQEFTFPELVELYYRYIENIQITCPRSRHIGNDVDGGYVVCEPLLPHECLAYSFGNRKDYSFDDGLAAHYNCEVHSFDPNDGQTDHQHGELVTFHKYGIGGKDEVTPQQMKIKTLDSLRTLLGHEYRPLDLLKIDTEGAEWASLTQILDSQALQKAHVKLLMVEFHMLFTKKDLDAYMTGLRTLRRIYEAGFRIYYFKIWSGGCVVKDPITHKERALCHEMHFLRL